MRTWKIAAAIAPLLIAATPMAGQQKPIAPPAAAPAPKPAAPAAAPAPASATLAATAPVAAARRPQLEITAGIGGTVMDLTAWSTNKTATLATNWGMVNYSGAARLLLPVGTGSALRLGVELGYNHHFWWNQPSGQSWVYYNPVTAFHAAALVRLPVGPRFTADLGGAFHFFNNAGSHPGALLGLTYHVAAGKSLDVPIGLRTDFIFANPTIIPIVLNAGVGFRL